MTTMKLISCRWKSSKRAIKRIQNCKDRENSGFYTERKVLLKYIYINLTFYSGHELSEEEEEVDEEENSGTETENDPTDLEKIFNERSNALKSVSSTKLDPYERKPRKSKKRTAQLAFDFALLRVLELEASKKLKSKLGKCHLHRNEISRECFDCSLINIIP